MKVAIACDHGGFELKQEILELLKEKNIQFEDFGCYDGCAVDYPDYAFKVSESVVAGQFDRGILICGTGIGISIAANKVKGFVVLWFMIYFQPRQRENTMIQIY